MLVHFLARIVASPVLRVAFADLAEDPGDVDAGTAAGEEEVIVELVLLRCRALQCCAFDREHDRCVVWGEKDVSAEAVRLVFPAKRKALI